MRKINTLLMTAALGFTALGATAAETEAAVGENPQIGYQREYRGLRVLPNQRSLVWVLGAEPTDDVWVLREGAMDIYTSTLKRGWQQSHAPHFLITDRQHNAIFGIGGYVNFRGHYDFYRTVNNKDFVVYDIPTVKTIDNKQRLRGDASTSRIFMKSIFNTDAVGMIEGFIEADFRGGDNVLRLREAYVSMLGFTIGQTATTFVDLLAAPRTIDFQGPNGYTYHRNLMVRWSPYISENFDFAIALEKMNVSGTSNGQSHIGSQRLPDIPAYIQFNWDDRRSHVRLSGLLRLMNYVDDVHESTITKVGWAAQVSTNIALGDYVNIFANATYGEGYQSYIQDLYGRGQDLVYHTGGKAGKMMTLPALSWLAGLQVNFNPQWQMNLTYSQVNVWQQYGYNQTQPGDQYRFGRYIVGNLFYDITPAITVGAEYLFGSKKNAGTGWHNANRASMMVQFSF